MTQYNSKEYARMIMSAVFEVLMDSPEITDKRIAIDVITDIVRDLNELQSTIEEEHD